MKKRIIKFWIQMLAAFLVFWFLMTKIETCNYTPLSSDTTKVIDTTFYLDTIKFYDTIPVKPAKEIIYIEVPADVDTAEILKKYYAKVFRDDTLMNDSGLFFRLQQEITQNDVVKQTIEVHDYEQTKVITKETTIKVPVPAPKYYIGVFSLYQPKNAVTGGKFMFKTKKDIFISGGYGTGKTIIFDAVIPINKLFTKNK